MTKKIKTQVRNFKIFRLRGIISHMCNGDAIPTDIAVQMSREELIDLFLILRKLERVLNRTKKS